MSRGPGVDRRGVDPRAPELIDEPVSDSRGTIRPASRAARNHRARQPGTDNPRCLLAEREDAALKGNQVSDRRRIASARCVAPSGCPPEGGIMQRWNRPEPAPTKRSTFTIPTTDRATQVARLRRDASRYAICTTCHGLREIPPGRRSEPLQPCACSPERLRREWNTDLAERVHLCECCCLELLPSGSRFSVWFCPDCGDRVRELNAQLGRYTIPLARHSFMAGVGIPGRVLLDADEEQLSAISESLRLGILGWIESISRLHAYTSDRIDDLARVVGLDGLDTIP